MFEDFKVLTQKAPGKMHRETKIFLDWEGVTESQLRVMAKTLIIYHLQAKWQKQSEAIPEEVKLKVSNCVHFDAPSNGLFKAPKPKDKLDKLLAMLTPEEMAILVKDLETEDVS